MLESEVTSSATQSTSKPCSQLGGSPVALLRITCVDDRRRTGFAQPARGLEAQAPVRPGDERDCCHQTIILSVRLRP
jgi:hypothetical protein